ncbi:hypothetical protein Mycch_1496 [Mycolicibacterium chubuense NBB4]|uniref:Adenylate kinase n=2 Tax=Mycolicibacterium chubuense TaxID=1800 RepID=I4BG89_MYCCN|nr:hypothetical protein Mycch_1496 [Mycolicibacterium chubuense NBB4]
MPATEATLEQPWMIAGNLGAEVHETHTGLVALLGARAYKAKKAVVTDFLDFSTVDRREAACRREVELNRRLAPDSYLGIGRFRAPDGADEPVIVMRRYPDSARLAALVRAGMDVRDHLTAIATVLARFHRDAARGPAIDHEASHGAVAERWQENLGELQQHAGTVVSAARLAEVTRLARLFLAGRHALYAQRSTDGRVVDGHGDLLGEDIFCTAEGPVLLDCLEFDDRLRYVDGIDDAAFLAMDLEFLGSRTSGDFFLAEYRRQAGDPAPRSLADFCIAYRAVVRAKVDCVRVGQGHADAAGDAQRHLSIAEQHLRAATVRLVVVGGGPGTGKTTLARALADRLGAQVISTDDVRRDLQDCGAIGGPIGDLDAGLYAPENAGTVYAEVLSRARASLSAGRSVILDGTWRDAGRRTAARLVAADTSCPVIELRCVLPVEEAVRRVAARGSSTSDATPAIAAKLAAEEAEWPQARPIGTGRPLDENVAEALRECLAALWPPSRP